MNDKLISIIVPAYNVEKYIGQCITSILSQTYTHFELLIVNDGSTDHTKTICEKYTAVDKRIKLISVSNHGVSAARNIGLNNAEGDYIFFVDSDDWIESETLMEMKSKLDATNCDSIMCSYYEFDSTIENTNVTNNRIINNSKKVYNRNEIIDAMCYMENPYSKFDLGVVWGVLYKKEIINKVRFNENISIGEDFEFKYKVLLNAKSVICVENQYYNYRIHSQSAMRGNFDKKKFRSFIELEKFLNSNIILSEFKEAVRVRITNIAIVLLLMIPFDKQYIMYRKQIENFIKQNRNKVLKNSRTRSKVKGSLFLTFLGFNLMEKLFFKLKSKEII